MTRYPFISKRVDHDPRPTTNLLERFDAEFGMFTSPSLLPQSERKIPQGTSVAGDADHPQFLLFGDSITQFSTLTLQAYLQTQYIRRLDVVNRGLSGFTAPMGFRALQKFLPSTTPRSTWPRIKIVTVLFGANDACLPGEPQHVELQSYADTIKKMISYPVFQQEGSRKTNIIVITPPPVNEHQLERIPSGHFKRRAGIISQYARAAQEVGKAYGAHVLDFWAILMHKVGWQVSMGRECCCDHIPCHIDTTPPPPACQVQHIPGCCHIPASSPDADYQLSDFLTDGLHLTELGYDVLFWELLKLIKREMPDCAPENLPFIIPEWRNALRIPDYCT